MKKVYIKPDLKSHKLQFEQKILTGSDKDKEEAEQGTDPVYPLGPEEGDITGI